jgi:cell pole-organizing protein PopZ
MSRADGAPEASIEEILASIRKNFTDDAPGGTASSPAQAKTGELRSAGLPSFRSATVVSTEAQEAPLPKPPRSRAAAIDDDLDDLIDKKAAPSPELKHPAAPATPALSPVEAAREKWAHLLNPGGSANGARSLDAPALKIDPAPASSVPPAASQAPSPPAATGLFAPRKGGFYPPSETRPEPVLPLPAAAPPPASETLVAKALEQTLPAAPRPGFIPSVAAPLTATPAPDPAPVSPTLSASAPLPVSRESRSAPEPLIAPAPAADLPAASARALDDLVAGLNSVAQPVAVPPQPAPRPQPAPPAAAPVAGDAQPVPRTSGRTLEDVVADMLRPLLEKWIDENMPRIVERALQRDAMLGRKTP